MIGFFRRLRARWKNRDFSVDLQQEMAAHRAMAEDDWRASGAASTEARRRGARQFGNVTLAREDARAVWIAPWMESVCQDVTLARRTLVAHRRFTVTAVAMLALAIGITSAMFTVIDALVVRPAPFREPDQLAIVLLGNERGTRSNTLEPSIFKVWRESGVFDAVESAVPGDALLEAGSTVVEHEMAAVTPGVFAMLGGVAPLHGRLFHEGEGQPGRSDRVLMSERVWQTLYGADPGLVGRSVVVNDEALTVVGILPAEFRFPSASTRLWRPTDLGGPGERARPYVRFPSDMPREGVLRLATDAASGLASEPREARRVALASPIAGLSDDYSTRALPLLAGGVVLVFLILCVNVSVLLLARGTARRREHSMRAALGASRGRLFRQSLAESAVLSALGVIAGVGVAWAMVSVARALLPDPILQQTLNPLNVDNRSFVASSATGFVAAMVAGLLPAWLSTRLDAGDSLRASERSGTETASVHTVTRVLLAAEVALACTLLIGASLLTRSFVNLAGADKGLDIDGVTTAWLVLPRIDENPEASQAGREALAQSIETELRRLPGLQQLAWSYGIPPEGGFQDAGIWISDDVGTASPPMEVNHYVVSPEFFSLYGIPIVRGHGFAESDARAEDGPRRLAAPEVIVGERFARAVWGNGDPVGRTFRRQRTNEPATDAPDVFRVLGVARELHYPSLEDDSRLDGPEIYHLYSPAPTPMISLRCEPACDTAAVRHRLASTLPTVRVQRAGLTADRYAREVVRPRASAALAVTFAGIGVAAAVGGLFSVLSYAVSRRRREFGIRVALGASPRSVREVVLRDGLIVVGCGLAIGVLPAAALARGLAALQYGVTPADPVSWTLAFAVVLLAALAASWGPARMASQVDPASLIRDQ